MTHIWHSTNTMMKFKSVLYKELIELNLYIITLCQFKCPYCYSRYENLSKWNKIMDLDLIHKIVEGIKYSKGNFSISLLGGEPTLHPHFYEIISSFTKIKNIKEVIIYTNGVKPIDIIDDKVRVVFAFHPSENNVNLKKNILSCKCNKKISLSLVKKFQNEIKDMYNFAVNNSIEIEPTFITNPKNKHFLIPKIIQYENHRVYDYNGTKYNLLEVCDNNLDNFKGWKCYINSYEIDVDGECRRECSSKKYDINNMFKDMKYDYIVCKCDKCVEQCLLDYTKIKS